VTQLLTITVRYRGPHLCQSLLLQLRVRLCAQTLTPCCRDSCPLPAVTGSGPRTRPRHRTCRGQACQAGRRGCQQAHRHLQAQQHQHRNRLLHRSGRHFRHSRQSMLPVEQLVGSHGDAAVCAVSRRDQAVHASPASRSLSPSCARRSDMGPGRRGRGRRTHSLSGSYLQHDRPGVRRPSRCTMHK
jgi:hypothetical protein